MKVVVIGGGLGGLAAALRLAASGYSVQLFEKTESLGGKMNRLRANGYTFDTGPSLITMPFVIKDLFRYCRADAADFIEFEPIDPLCRYFFSDGAVLDAFTQPAAMHRSMAPLCERDADQFESFLEYSKQLYDLTADIFLFTPIHEPSETLKLKNLPMLFKLGKLDAFHTVHERVSSFFKDSRIIQLFDRYCTYNGSDPYQAPATLNIIPYVEYGLGGYYIKGGLYKLIEALETLADSLGVDIVKNAPVEQILHQKHVQGIKVNGETINADHIICNADVVTAHQTLLDSEIKYTKKLESFEPSTSGLVFFWGVRGQHQELGHHNIFFSKNYQQEFQTLSAGHAPDDPTIYVAMTSKRNKSHAPDGYENWFVLLNMPFLAGQDWPEQINRMRRVTLQKLAKHGFDIKHQIKFEQMFTPLDFYSRYGSNKGSIYGISSNDRNMAFKRPPNKSRQVKGLYFAGASTHPGGGVPLALLSGKHAADLLIRHSHN
ncbi:MAG: phytoene desaturase family protein [candidate division KSB1 bacterium]|nr:phytoene desaturase family protein [candidate division KSB1 bacterium]